MGFFASGSSATYQYFNFGGFLGWWRTGAPNDTNFTLTETGVDALVDNVFEVGEDVQISPGGNTFDYVGTYTFAGTGGTYEFIVLRDQFTSGTSGQYHLHFSGDAASAEYPFGFDPGAIVAENTPVVCFAAGTRIATPQGEKRVEELGIGELIRTADGRSVPVRWIGRQTVRPILGRAERQLVRMRAGALGDGLPQIDLTVTADHGMVMQGHVINASALVNGTTIDWVPSAELPETVTVYHVETEAHDVILANGAPSETFIDYRDRRSFDNFDEYLDLYGAERIIPEMPRPRISSRRLLPDRIRQRLGGAVRTAGPKRHSA